MTDTHSASLSSSPPANRDGNAESTDGDDPMAQLAARANQLSQEAANRMATSMKDLISSAAGIAGFAIESARDLVQFMVRRGQLSSEEAEELMRDVEAAQPKRKPGKASASAEGSTKSAASSKAAAKPKASKAKAGSKAAAKKKAPAKKKAVAKKKAPARKKAAPKKAAKPRKAAGAKKKKVASSSKTARKK